MADPLSIAGSIAGIISLADTVFRLVFKYARSSINATEEVKNLADELQSLAGILQSLRLLASGLEAEGPSFDPTIRMHHLGALSTILSRLEQRVEKAHKKFESDSKTKQILQRLKWPFSTSETKELLNDLLRHKTIISLALSADSLRKLQVCLTTQEEQRQTLSSIETTVKRIEINTQITLSDRKKKVLDFFMKVTPQPNFKISVKLRHPMTGLWLTGSPSFTSWLETPGSKLWLSGIPGAGKTVLAGAVIQEAIARSDCHPDVGVAFFFCDYKDSHTWDTVNILGALASQLGRQNDNAYDSLQTYYNELHPSGRLEMSSDTEDLRGKITQMSEHFKQIIVIVDGLDECGDSSDVVVETLWELATYTSKMSIALFSRHEVNIEGWLREDFDHISIAAMSHDVRLYVRAEMEKRIQNRRLRILNMDLKDEIISKLVEGAQGMFRWVACQLDYLCDCVNDADRRKALSELPPDLPETYRRLLDRVNKQPAKVQSLVQMCLQFIAFASPSLTVLQLQQAVSTPETLGVSLDTSNLISEEEIGRRCTSLIRKSKDVEDRECFEFSHFSVKEFLTDLSLLDSPTLNIYHLTESRSYKVLASQCLRFLQLKNFERQPESSKEEADHRSSRNSENPFYEHAAMTWPEYARNHLDDPLLFNLACSLFQRPKTAHFLAWSVKVIGHIYGRFVHQLNPDTIEFCVDGVTDVNFSPLHLAAALHLPNICQFLIDDEVDVNLKSVWGSPLEFATAGPHLFETEKLIYLRTRSRFGLDQPKGVKDQLATMELLVGAGADPTYSRSRRGTNLLDLSFEYAGYSHDLSGTTKLLSLGLELGTKNSDSFRRCMASWRGSSRYSIDLHQDKMTSTLHDFLGHLISTSTHTTEIGCEIASLAYSFASESSFPWVSEFGLIGSDLACAETFLHARAMTAVIHDDTETLLKYLANKNGDASRIFHPKLDFPGYSCSLLHVAAMNNSPSASRILLDFGYDLSSSDSDGNLPIHLCSEQESVDTLNVFLEKDASHLATDSKGNNIWHKCLAGPKSSVLKRLLELDQDQTTQALIARNSSGETPVVRGLRAPGYLEPIPDKLLHIIDHCAGKPRFWKAHGPVFFAAAMFGSETVIERLIKAGAERDPVGDDNFTPLHLLGPNTNPKCVNVLKNLYPDAPQLRFEGQTPLEMLIERTLKLDPYTGIRGRYRGRSIGSYRGRFIDRYPLKSLAVLATPEAISSQNCDGDTVWSIICKKFPDESFQDESSEDESSEDESSEDESSEDESWVDESSEDESCEERSCENDSCEDESSEFSGVESLEDMSDDLCSKHFNTAIATLLSFGALASYEEKKRESGILPLFSALLLKWKHNGLNERVISRKTLSAIISKSAYWDDARRLPDTVSFLKHAVANNHLDTVELLLENGVSVHQRVDKKSPMEFAVECFEITRVPMKEFQKIMLALFSHAAAEEMKKYNPHGLGLGLLHMVAEAQHKKKTHAYWLLQELIRWGVDVNGDAKFEAGYTPLMHHLSQSSFRTAEILLDLGASPSANSTFDLLCNSVSEKAVTFFQRLLRYSKETGTYVPWNETRPCRVEINGCSKVIYLPLLHFIAYCGLNETLDLYIDEGLVEDINVTSAEGYTAVHLAAASGGAAVISRLQAQGVNLSLQSRDGSTALHLAVRNKHLSAIKVLLELGATSSLDAFAKSPRMYASALSRDDMIELLDQHLLWAHSLRL